MNSPRRLIFLLAVATLAAEKPPPVPIAKQIDALLKARLRPEPLPLDLPNPFVMAGGARRETGAAAAAPSADGPEGTKTYPDKEARTASEPEVLAECAARLRIGGMIRAKDQVQLIINDAARKDGDIIVVPWNGTRIPLRLVRILPDQNQLVLRYAETELTMRF